MASHNTVSHDRNRAVVEGPLRPSLMTDPAGFTSPPAVPAAIEG